MSEIVRDFEGSFSPISLPEQEHLDQITRDCAQVGFECLQRRRLHNLWTAHSNALSLSSLGEVLPHICMELPVLQLLPVAPYPVTEHLQRAQPHPLDFHTLDAYKQ